eukprot:scaffold1132_cov238-Pinguiococcus_pyrenoidosus.AAC.3
MHGLVAIRVHADPFGKAQAEAPARSNVRLLSRTLGDDGAVMQRVNRVHIVRDAEEEEAKVQQHRGHGHAGEFRTAAMPALRAEGRAQLAVDLVPVAGRELVPPFLHLPRNAS